MTKGSIHRELGEFLRYFRSLIKLDKKLKIKIRQNYIFLIENLKMYLLNKKSLNWDLYPRRNQRVKSKEEFCL